MVGSFLQIYNFEPKWIPSNAWGHVDPESGNWVGAVSEIGRDQADLTIGQLLGCSAPRMTQATCMPSMGKNQKEATNIDLAAPL